MGTPGTPRLAVLGIALASAGAVLTACGSGGSGVASGGQAPRSSAAAATTIATVITVHHGKAGTYLTGAHGRALYEFASDTATHSSCNATCRVYWPPVTGTVHAGPGVAPTKVRTLRGTGQLSYDGHPLYYFTLDRAPGQTSGQGRDDFGAKWWLLTPAGGPLTSTAGSSGSSGSNGSSGSSGDSGGGGGYGGGGW